MNIFELLIVQPLFNLLMVIYAAIPGGDFGISIIVFTILLRLVMYPLVKKQLHQTKKMRKLQPELERIKKQTKGNRQLQGVQMMELYKRHGVSPFRSVGILIVQLPVFISLYLVIRVFALHRGELVKWTYDFLEKVPSIGHIIQHPEQFNEKLFGFVNLTESALAHNRINVALVVLAVAAAIGQYIQSKQTMPQPSNKRKLRDILKEASGGQEADQSEINSAVMGKMIFFLPFFMLFIMLTLPGAIALYYAVTTLVAVIQQTYILRQDEDELEEIASEHPANTTGKKATAKARAKVADEATVTRIVATSHRPSTKKRTKGGK